MGRMTAAEVAAKSAKARAAHYAKAPNFTAQHEALKAQTKPGKWGPAIARALAEKPAKPAELKPTEAQEQKAVIDWFAAYAHTVGLDARLLFAIPNGSWLAGDARQRAIQMSRLKATGLRVGVPDLFLALPCVWFHGLFVEMKRSVGGRVSDDQRDMALLLESRHYQVVTSKGSDEAIRAIKGYLERRQ